MARRRLVFQLFPAFVLVTVFSLLAVTIATTRSVRGYAMDRAADDLLQRTRAVERLVPSWLEERDGASLDDRCADLGGRTESRITVTALDGVVLGDSDESSATMDNHALRLEISEALAGRSGRSLRYSHTLRTTMLYQAVPVMRDDEMIAVVRLAVPLTSIEEELRRISWSIVSAAVLVMLLAAVVSFWLARRMSRPLELLRHGVRRFAEGRLDHRLPLGSNKEIAHLAEAMNQMAEQLDDRIRTIENQRNELGAVFAGMVEGVLVIDSDEKVVELNRAAAGLLGTTVDEARGRTIPEVIRTASLQEFVSRSFHADGAVVDDLDIRVDGRVVMLQAHGVRLDGGAGARRRVLVVLNDVTRLRRLENVRRDFVANVSHELKTPVTAIKGFVETLVDGGLENQEDTRRFLDIIARQSRRLDAIIEDLLCLSRLEQGTGETLRGMGVYPLGRTLASALQTCQLQADARSMSLNLDCPAGLKTRFDPPLLEQAVVNLVSNAVKYSEEGDAIEVSADTVDDHVLVSVRDHGRGIEPQHLPRLFERFYRVDKARSRQQGGTGLGLAIVKHIALFHGGTVTVRSTPGDGCLFTLHLPLNRV
jgi:two-component system, OmpR family, phosphate regulon sensor histidine kinase PhoR